MLESNDNDDERLGFFSGLFCGLMLPLLLLGGEINAKRRPKESFFGGLVFGFAAWAAGLSYLFFFKP